MSPSELKYHVEQAGHEQYFFTRETMRFFGDSMRNYGVRQTVITSDYNDAGEYVPDGVTVKVWELYRKHAVKHGNKSSAYFAQDTFRRVHARVEVAA